MICNILFIMIIIIDDIGTTNKPKTIETHSITEEWSINYVDKELILQIGYHSAV